MRIWSVLFGIIAFLAMAATSQAATLVTSGGILTGATGVTIGSSTYDVQFVDGSCDSLFAPCTFDSDLGFSGTSASDAAASALVTQVFAGGTFDTGPGLTQGCTATSACNIYIPSTAPGTLGTIVQGTKLVNTTGVGFLGGDFIDRFSINVAQSTASLTDTTFAVFTLTGVTTTPLPGALPLMLSALGAMGLFAWRRQATLGV